MAAACNVKSAFEYENRVLLAMDSSHHASETFEYYLDHVHRQGSYVILVYVIELPDCADDAINLNMSQDVLSDLWKKEAETAQQIEKKYLSRLKQEGVNHMTAINRSGTKPGKVIVKMAEEYSTHMIVIGSKGRGRIRGKLLGSTSDYVMHHANCPVLVCRHGHLGDSRGSSRTSSFSSN